MFKKIIASLTFCFFISQGFTQEMQQKDDDQNGRYQLRVVHSKDGTDRAVYILDTQTGSLWRGEVWPTFKGWKQFPPLPSTFPPFPDVTKQEEGVL